MIASAVTARGDCMGVSCVVVEFRGLGMFALRHMVISCSGKRLPACINSFPLEGGKC
jgi:hypothetical protein